MCKNKKYLSMKKYILYVATAVACGLFTACNVLDKEPNDSIAEERVWSDAELAKQYLNNLYNQAQSYLAFNPTFGGGGVAALSDETGPSSGNSAYIYGQLTQESVGVFSNDTYSKIRKINIFLEKVTDGGITDKITVKAMLGQALFLRAMIYWDLVKLYGGVPMVMRSQAMSTTGETTEEILVHRSKTGACIDSIVRDLDLAAEYLAAVPNETKQDRSTWNASWDAANYGRITRGAAMALKSRVLLFWASPQFNPQNRQERWERAYTATKNAIDTLVKDGYGLHPSFTELFEGCKEQTKEHILVRVYNENIAGSYSHGYDNGVRPIYEGLSGGKSNNPSWELVQAFPKKNGYPADTMSGVDQAFWKDRDDRFYKTIAYNGCVWSLSGQSGLKIWTYFYTNEKGGMVSTEGSTYTETGFYCRKFVNPTIKKGVVDKVGTDWVEIRYAEVLLNLAECANEMGYADEAYRALNEIRNGRTDVKVGMGYIDDNKSDKVIMREIIMTERQVELAFEGKRHWDLRRRNMFEEDLGPNIKKLNGTRRNAWRIELNPNLLGVEGEMKKAREKLIDIGGDRDFDLSDIWVFHNYFKDGYKKALDEQYTINFPQPKYNFYPIQQTNLDKNVNLAQSAAWGGTFDPLAE
jgi:hypothetical protein